MLLKNKKSITVSSAYLKYQLRSSYVSIPFREEKMDGHENVSIAKDLHLNYTTIYKR